MARTETHNTYTEKRTATCCDQHRDTWIVCTCGFEMNCRDNSNAESDAVILGHRIDVLAKKAGITFKNEPLEKKR